MNNDPKERREHSILNAIEKVLVNLIPFIYAFTCIVPVVWLFYTSFKTMSEFSANVIMFPKSFLNFSNFNHVFTKMQIGVPMFNTIRNTAIIVGLVIVFAFINGYFFARFRFRGRGVMMGLYMCNLLIPIHAILVPTYILFSFLGWDNQWFSTILPTVCMEMTTSIFLVVGYVSTIPRELEEAASIDGSSFSRTLFSIIFPIIRPVLVTVGIISFFHAWNEFPFSLVMFSNEKLYTLPLAVTRFKGDYVTDFPRTMALLFVSIAPALLLYSFFSKQIIKGVMAGAIKG